MEVNGQGCVPGQLNLQNQATGRTCLQVTVSWPQFLETEETLQISRNTLAVSTHHSFTSRSQGYVYKLYLSVEHELSESGNFVTFIPVSSARRWAPAYRWNKLVLSNDLVNEYIHEWAAYRFVKGNVDYRWFSCITDPTPTAIPSPLPAKLNNYTGTRAQKFWILLKALTLS